MLTLQPIKKDLPLLFETNQVQTGISRNIFTAQDASIFSRKKLKHCWNCVLFTKHLDKTLQRLGKTIGYEYMSKQFLNSSQINHTNILVSAPMIRC